MTASVLKQDPNTKRFKRTLIHFDTDTQIKGTEQATKTKPKQDKFLNVYLLFKCRFVA